MKTDTTFFVSILPLLLSALVPTVSAIPPPELLGPETHRPLTQSHIPIDVGANIPNFPITKRDEASAHRSSSPPSSGRHMPILPMEKRDPMPGGGFGGGRGGGGGGGRGGGGMGAGRGRGPHKRFAPPIYAPEVSQTVNPLKVPSTPSSPGGKTPSSAPKKRSPGGFGGGRGGGGFGSGRGGGNYGGRGRGPRKRDSRGGGAPAWAGPAADEGGVRSGGGGGGGGGPPQGRPVGGEVRFKNDKRDVPASPAGEEPEVLHEGVGKRDRGGPGGLGRSGAPDGEERFGSHHGKRDPMIGGGGEGFGGGMPFGGGDGPPFGGPSGGPPPFADRGGPGMGDHGRGPMGGGFGGGFGGRH
ncbi:Hypothetical protein D9617_1g079640 [Elsinoe fawcettii]|nr:Hypothetical protein D9617_1g079640 [Elsinoe fawcettii]